MRYIQVIRDNKRKILVGAAIAVLMLLWVYVLLEVQGINSQWGEPRQIMGSECAPYGYEVTGDLYTNVVGDAHVQLPELNQEVYGITLNFQQPLAQPLNICVYYAQEDHGYSEAYTSAVQANVGMTQVTILLGEEITTARIDIGTDVGEAFYLDEIVINSASVKQLYQFELCMKGIVLTVLVLAIGAIFLLRLSNEKIVAGMVVVFGLLYCVTMTPLSPPDEPHHYHSAYQLSNYLMLRLNSLDQGDARHFDYTGLTSHANTEEGYLRILEDFTTGDELEGEVTIPTPRNLRYFVEYLPQAIGISAGRILGLGFVGVFYLGRLCNLLFYSACVYWAIRMAKRFRPVLAMVTLLPMSLHQAASYSYDGFINGIAFLLIAYLINGIYGTGALSKTEYVRILLLGMLLAPAKVVYAAILLLALAIPGERFENRRQQVIKLLLLFAAAGAMVLLFQLPMLTKLSADSAESALNWEGQHNYDLNFIFEHPIKTARIFVDTLKAMGSWYYETCIGRRLSGLTLVLPSSIVSAFTVLLVLAIPERADSPFQTKRGERFLLGAIFIGVVLLIMLSMFLGWTSDTRTTIQGVQGRYFLPILPLGLMALSNRTIVRTRDYLKWQYAAVAVLQSWIIIYIIQYTI